MKIIMITAEIISEYNNITDNDDNKNNKIKYNNNINDRNSNNNNKNSKCNYNSNNNCYPLSPQGMIPNQVNQTMQEAVLQALQDESQVWCPAGALYFIIMILFSGRVEKKDWGQVNSVY